MQIESNPRPYNVIIIRIKCKSKNFQRNCRGVEAAKEYELRKAKS
jgi:hypothetical protein